ncbi:MAG: O-antigen ligase family protein [Betaproteobacteria bacterium]
MSTSTPHPLLLAGWACLGAWLLYLLIAPTVGFNWIDSWHNEQRAVQLVLLGASTAVAIALLLLGAVGVSTLLCGFLAAGALSAALSSHPAAGYAEIGLFIMLGLTSVMVATVTRGHVEAVTRAIPLTALLIGAAHVTGIAVRVLAAHSVDAAPEVGIFMLGYANPRFASALYVMLLPLVAAVAVDPTRRVALRVAAVAVMTGLWAANIGLGTRGVWLAFALALPLCSLAAGWRQAKALVMALLGSAVLGALLYLAIAALLVAAPAIQGESLSVAVPEGLLNATLTLRDVLWIAAAEAWMSRPLLGLGPMQLAATASFVGAHPHNWILQLLAEWGAVASALLIAWLVLAARRLRLQGAPTPSVAAVWLALLAALALALVDGTLVMPVSQSVFVLLCGVALAQAPAARQTSPRWLRLLVARVITAAAVHALQFANASYIQQEAETAKFRKRHPGAWLTPRLWETGTMFLERDR